MDEHFQTTENQLYEIIAEFNKEYQTSLVSTLLPIKSVGVQGNFDFSKTIYMI